MIESIVLVVVGLLVLIGGGELLLRGAVGLATLLRLTPAVIGLTVVAAGTSVPEFAVGVIAALRGNADISVGNVVGSNIFNIAAILGLGALVAPLVISGNTVRLEYPVMAAATLLTVLLAHDGEIDRIEAAGLVALYVGFTAYLVTWVRRQVNETEAGKYREEVQSLGVQPDAPPRAWLCLMMIALGIALLGIGADATVAGASDLARRLGLSDRIIGLTIVAAGTGLPEVVTTLVSAYRGRDDVAIGNVIGSNLFNLLIVLGLTGVIQPLPVDAAIIRSDNWWMLAVTILMFPLIFTRRRVDRWEGILLLVIYFIYITLVIVR